MNDQVDRNQIRSLRRSLGLTQARFAERLGVSKVTVARWESGARNCQGQYAQRVIELEREHRTRSIRTSTIFTLSGDDLSRLDATGAVEAFRDLLWCEARLAGLSRTDVEISLREVPDGGIDAVVGGVKRSQPGGLLASGSNHFQIKAGATAKPWQPSSIRKELFGKRKAVQRENLGRGVVRCLDQQGRYVMACFGVDLTPDQTEQAEKNISGYFQQCGFPNARVDVWGQQQLIGAIRPFPSLALKLLARHDYEFQCHWSWSLDSQMSTRLCLGEEQKQLVAQIQECMRGDDIRHVRVLGEPGLGKTRLVLHALSAEDLAPNVVYVSHAEAFQHSRLFNHLLRPDIDYFVVLVLDECPPRECASIWNRLRNRSERCRVISMDHDPDSSADPQMRVLECPRLKDEQTAKIIEGYVGQHGDAKRWAEFCSGSPRVAHLVGQNLRTNPDDMLRSPSTVPIWDRFIAAHHRLDSVEAKRKATVLRHLALFYRFGFEGPVEEEAHFVADLVRETDPDITWGRFQSIVHELKQLRIIQGTTTLFIVPKLLHIYLWKEFWEHHGRGVPLNDLIPRLPGQLSGWFIRMFRYARESAVASQQVEAMLGPAGPFSCREFLVSPIGCSFLNELGEASPEATLKCLERTIGQWDHATLMEFDSGRHYVICALEKIAVWPNLFYRAATLLRKLGEAENATYSNNASGVFAGLFSLAPGRAAPTGATPKERIPALQDALTSGSAVARALGLKACRAALSVESPCRAIGPEYQGIRPTVQLWTPRTWGEVHRALGMVWESLTVVSRHWDHESRGQANAVLVQAATDLLQIESLAETVLATLDRLIDDPASDLRQFVEMIAGIRRFGADAFEDSVLDRLKALDERITGSSFATRLNRVVHLSGWDDYLNQDGEDDGFSQRVADLASEAVRNDEEFGSVLRDLVRGTNNTICQFGLEVGRRDESRSLLPSILEAYRQESGGATDLLLSGYLASVFESGRAEWDAVIYDIISDGSFRALVGLLVRNSGFTDQAIEHLIREYDSGRLDVESLVCLRYSRSLRGLRQETFLGILERLRIGGAITCALEMLDYVYCTEGDPRQLPEELTFNLLRDTEASNRRTPSDDYHWAVVADQFVGQFPQRAIDVFEAALDKICSRDWRLRRHTRPYGVIQSIIQSAPVECWSLVSARLQRAERMERWRLLEWLGPSGSFGAENVPGPLALFPPAAVLDWVAEAPSERAPDIARVAVPKSLARDELGAFARELLNRYGDQDSVRRSLFAHFWSGGWCGSASAYYRRKRDTARKWLESETSMRVRQWIEEYIDALSHDIKRAEIEEEREF